jgi:hypothetical protein
VDNIYGIAQDDIVAVTNLVFSPELNFLGSTIHEIGKGNLNMHDIVIRNINRPKPAKTIGNFTPPVLSGGVLLLCEDGLKIHDVSIDGVTGYAQVNIGFTNINCAVMTQVTINDMYNITVQNAPAAPVHVNRPIKNSSILHVPALDVTITHASAQFKTGSQNVMRKCHGSNFEFFTIVYVI